MGKLLQVWRVAEILDCSKRFVYALIDTGELRVIRLGIRGLRIKEDSLAEYIKKVELKTN